jgi:hypothetical protein
MARAAQRGALAAGASDIRGNCPRRQQRHLGVELPQRPQLNPQGRSVGLPPALSHRRP